ncbi:MULTISPECIES: flagellar motor stator protein MotA [Asaia]|uniref:Flagellar motor protein MotA n=2 Tax=Asaia bogorensis TaxID=91915 RepID=A0AAN4R0V0_9PROT|nr:MULTISPECIES: flagellar motor stator protein MotA [Asaia]ETC97177.1 flagellar motor protein MotA [Asaia sp. SF2.1]NIE79469.1 flagellar motor stator protein MotA [Asaia sp. As-1742]CDG40550.1 Flagellar motor rotation protein MotA [Asaia bogorensis]BAT20553.1 flagellar motor chemotaxis protein MotA [Asaia bogorensis NBRC 16594]GBQ78940.1 flagellar motor protein MotA [Asaia bogorensis NBRC 16594]
MLFIGGLVFSLLCVFGSFAASGGVMGPLLASMPFELITILGSALGIFVMSNSIGALKELPHNFKLALKGPQYDKAAYVDLLVVLFRLTRLAQAKGAMALEEHVENPQDSGIFALSPKVRDDTETRDLICDYLRLVSLNLEDAYQLDDVMARELRKNQAEKLHISECLTSIADALPALGIVAAVLGVIKTMASISKPPAILGEMISGALVGTFLGVLLSYGVVAPLASRIKAVIVQDGRYQGIIKTVLVAHLQGNPPQVSAEIGRKEIPPAAMPSFFELDVALTESQGVAS